ncbi:putative leukotriene A-4 hydrolase (LTA-4 hydrolase) (Leukotriene A(4) hydrolase), partial [Quaeritorhiza haematococci]
MCRSHFEPDPSTLANVHQLHVKHTHLNWTADFDRKVLHGYVVHDFVKAPQAQDGDIVKEVVLDTRGLVVKKAALIGEKGVNAGQELEFDNSKKDPMWGKPLVIKLPGSGLSVSTPFQIRIDYETTENSSAIQWLEPSQTVGKKYPYLFTQCQAIHARTLLPCQDTPEVKLTYSAEVTVPAPLRALMSAVPKDDILSTPLEGTAPLTFHFEQKISIPSYLIALAVGHLDGRKIGPRSVVWSEPEVVEAAAWEFVDTETFIATGEALLTPYTWGRYDLLLLPASFPYGGMENPCLTFVTPSLLAGDRSLVDVVAHEIAHSWMGNLVTTRNWQHFWLNEGFTVFIERKIIGRLHGEPSRHFSAIIGLKALEESVDHFKEIGRMDLTKMVYDGSKTDPDDAFSSVPY